MSGFQERLLDAIGRLLVALRECETKEELFERYGLDPWVLMHEEVVAKFERFPAEDQVPFGILLGVIYERLYPAEGLLSEEER